MATAMRNGRFSAHLREVRIERGFTQEGLAHKAGVVSNTVRRYESGQYQPTDRGLALIVQALGLKPLEKATFYYAAERYPPGSQWGLDDDGGVGLVVDGEWIAHNPRTVESAA